MDAPPQYRDLPSILERFRSRDVFLDASKRRLLNLCSEYFAVFNSELQMIDYNRSARTSLSNQTMPKRAMFEHSLFEFFPDLEISKDFRKVRTKGGSFGMQQYQLKGFNLNTHIHCALTVFKVDGITVVMGEDITDQIEHSHRMQEYVSRFERIEEEHRALLKAFNLLARRPEDGMYSIERQRESILEPLVSELKDTITRSIEAGFSALQNNARALLPAPGLNMTPREIEIANLIRAGKGSKEIAQILNLDSKTVDFHRRNLRRKFGIANQPVNLRSYLISDDPSFKL